MSFQEGFKDFHKDLNRAIKTERFVAKLIEQKFSATAIEFRNDSEYDIKFQRNSDNREFTIEVKEDFGAYRTGNIAVEHSCRGKLSGINVSKADFYLYRVHSSNGVLHLIMRASTLRRIISEKKYWREVNGGDIGSNSLCYLFKLREIEKISLNLLTIK